MSTTCPNCGAPLEAGHRFCSNCGYAATPPAGTESNAESNPSLPGDEPAAASTGAGATSPAEPVTYVVQRYDSAPPSVWAGPNAGGAVPDTEGTQGTQGAASAGSNVEPYPTFVPPPAPSVPSTPPATSESAYGSSSSQPVPPPPSPPNRTAYTELPTGGTSAYGNYTTPPSARPGSPSGAFMPYDAGVAKNLEKAPSQRSWLVPVIIAGLVVLGMLVGGAGYLFLNSTSDEDSVKAVIQQSNQAQISAWHNLDTSALKNTYTGQVLQDNVQQVQKLQQQHLYAIPVNQSLQFSSVNVQGDTAIVQTVEVWSVTFYDQQTNKVASSDPTQTLHETYHLVKQNGAWLIDQLTIAESQNQNSPNPTGTPNIT